MKAVIQRVHKAQVIINNTPTASIGIGMLVLLGIAVHDTEKKAQWIADKISVLRIFEDDNGKMNNSILDSNGEILVVSQFTLCAEIKKGRRPSFTSAAAPEQAQKLYTFFLQRLRQYPITIQEGVFQSAMNIELTNSGPATFIIER